MSQDRDKVESVENSVERASILSDNLTRLDMVIGDYEILEDRLTDSLDIILLPPTENEGENVKSQCVKDSRGATVLADNISDLTERLHRINQRVEEVIRRIDL